MKKIIIIFWFLSLIVIYSQDRENSPMKFNYIYGGVSHTNQIFSQDTFAQKNFMITTQWGGQPKMLEALKFNANQGTPPGSGSLYPADPNYKLYYIWDDRNYEGATGFQFNPTLLIPKASRGQFFYRPNDTTKSVFGFSTIKGTTTSYGNENFDRLILYKNDTTYNNGQVVLDSSWINNQYAYNSDTNYHDDKNGSRWYFSINLRRLDTNEVCSSTDTSWVLVISLPYSLRTGLNSWTTDSIKFDSVPSRILLDTIHLNYLEDRGIAKKFVKDTNSNKYNLIIRNNMIPDSVNRKYNHFNKDLTLNGYFICNYTTGNNPYLNYLPYPYIDSLDIRVRYYGHTSVAIKFLRIATPDGYKVLTGFYDSLKKADVQANINSIQNNHYEIYGMYGADEHNENHFMQERYNSRHYNYCTVSEGSGGNYPLQYSYEENPMHIWMGCNNSNVNTSVPYFSKNWNDIFDSLQRRNYYCLGYPVFGYKGYGYIKDTFNSSYENAVVNDSDKSWWRKNTTSPWWRALRQDNINNLIIYVGDSTQPSTVLTIVGMNAYKFILGNWHGVQYWLESGIYNRYFIFPNTYYSSNAWWANQYPCGNWNVVHDSVQNKNWAMLGYGRTQTGEEVRQQIWNALIFGAKGLGYDAHCQNFSAGVTNLSVGYLQMDNQPESLWTDTTVLTDTLLYSDLSPYGYDFIPSVDNYNHITDYVQRDSAGKYLVLIKTEYT
jgi:hypothetical protein